MSSPTVMVPGLQDPEEIPQPAELQLPSPGGHQDDDQSPPADPGTGDQA
ncbi:hypothetical protein [Streptomyces sp. YIM 121038]|nr:hypothetical protein [Streptomyces sp. YIM 121038]